MFRYFDSRRSARRMSEKYWFFRKLSVRPGNCFAISFQVDPHVLCSSSSRLPSASVHFFFESFGFSLFDQLSVSL